MIKKIISFAAGFAMICGNLMPFNSEAVSFDISTDNIAEYILNDGDGYQATDIVSPDEIPINDNVKDLDDDIIKIMIDPGHYSYYNQSPVYAPYYESVMTWKLSNYLQQELQALGVHADLTKSSLDEDPTLNDRGFSSKGYDFFISMHSNAGGYSSMDQPLAIVYQDLPWTDIDDISQEIGLMLAEKVSDVMGTNQKGTTFQRKGTGDWDRNGVLDDEWYSVLFGSRFVGTAGILLEHSFHTNYNATLWLYNDDNLKVLAKEEAELIYNYFKDKKGIITTKINYGDVNGDNLINAADASMVLEEYALFSTGVKKDVENSAGPADVNQDGKINANDASIILEFYMYLSTSGTETDIIKWLSNQ